MKVYSGLSKFITLLGNSFRNDWYAHSHEIQVPDDYSFDFLLIPTDRRTPEEPKIRPNFVVVSNQQNSFSNQSLILSSRPTLSCELLTHTRERIGILENVGPEYHRPRTEICTTLSLFSVPYRCLLLGLSRPSVRREDGEVGGRGTKRFY